MSNPNYDAIFTTTLENRRKKLVDNVFSARPLFYFLNKAGNIRTIDGGNKILTEVMLGQNNTAGFISEYGAMDLTPQEGISSAEWPWKIAVVNVVLSGLASAMNNGEEQTINLLEAKITQAEESLIELLDRTLIQGDGTTDQDAFFGLEHVVKNNATAVGGIDPSVVTNWKSYRQTGAGVLKLATVDHAYNSCSGGNDNPELGLTTQTLYEKFEALFVPNARYENTKVGDAGFTNIQHKKLVMTYDDYVAEGDMFLLNPKWLKLVGHKDAWLTNRPFQTTPQRDAKYAPIISYGNLTCSQRRRQGCISGLTA